MAQSAFRRAQSTQHDRQLSVRSAGQNWQRLVLFKLSSRWHCHSDSACLLCKGVSFLNHLNMVCGYTTSNHTQQRNAHTHTWTHAHTHMRTLPVTPLAVNLTNVGWPTNGFIFLLFSNTVILILPRKKLQTQWLQGVVGLTQLNSSIPWDIWQNHNSTSGLKSPVCLSCCRAVLLYVCEILSWVQIDYFTMLLQGST